MYLASQIHVKQAALPSHSKPSDERCRKGRPVQLAWPGLPCGLCVLHLSPW